MSRGPLPTHDYQDPNAVPHQAAIETLTTESMDEDASTEYLTSLKLTIQLLCDLRDGAKEVVDSTKPVECTTCGAPATHYWATLDPNNLQVSSINGLGHASPSCDECGGDSVEGLTVRVPIPVPEPECCDGCGMPFGEYDDRYHKHCG